MPIQSSLKEEMSPKVIFHRKEGGWWKPLKMDAYVQDVCDPMCVLISILPLLLGTNEPNNENTA